MSPQGCPYLRAAFHVRIVVEKLGLVVRLFEQHHILGSTYNLPNCFSVNQITRFAIPVHSRHGRFGHSF